MGKKLFSFVSLFIAAICLSVPAYAGVIYNWHQELSSSGISMSYGTLEVTDAAWRSGFLDVDYEHATYYPPGDSYASPTIPSSKILNFEFSINNPAPGRYQGIPPVEIQPRDFFAYGYIDAFLKFNGANPLIGGVIDADDGQSEAHLRSGASSLWTIGNFGSDYDTAGTLCGSDPCSGAIGRWIIDPSTIPESVPAPGMLGLFGLGLFGIVALAGYRRRLVRESA
jgi:hypothetical protein